jgi:tRNA(Ile)-lysidine synthase
VSLLEKVKAVLEQETLLPQKGHLFVGVSGGADSVAMLHVLHQLEYSVTAAHLNHSIRGAEADADEQFVKDLCAKLGIKCVTAKTDVPALAREKGVSLEMAARTARHDFFRALSSLVILAHHADDQLETFFLRAARGTGPGGLGGMRFFQILDGLKIYRPMLGIRRSEILHWLGKEKIEWREDASNTDETIPRNLVRQQILPILEKLNERAAENILRTMEILRDEEDRPELSARRREIRNWLIGLGVTPTFDAIEQVISFSEKTSGTQALDLEGLRITNEYGVLKIADAVASPRFFVRMEEGVGILRGPWEASVSLATVAGRAVTIRAASSGDRMAPYGMEGTRKLQDIFTDLKIPQAQRAQWPVVECGGEIIWLPGYRIARGWQLSADSEPALHLSVSSFSGQGAARTP